MPVDIPMVSTATIKRLLDVAEEHPDNIIFPVFGRRRGHPPLIPAGIIPAILEWREEGSLKDVLHAHEKLALEVPVVDSNILFDVDTAEDYLALLERFHRHEVPTDESVR
jgi:molybdenum cofactor cytidylyltransferase